MLFREEIILKCCYCVIIDIILRFLRLILGEILNMIFVWLIFCYRILVIIRIIMIIIDLRYYCC